MMTRIGILFAMAITLPGLAACAGAMGHNPPVGGIFAGAKGVSPASRAEVSDGVRPGSKTGEACAKGVLGIASWGDMSVAAAKKDGGITRVDTIDYKTMDILGIVYQKHCTILTGGDDAGGSTAMVEPEPEPEAEPEPEEEPEELADTEGDEPPPPPPPA